MSHSQPSDATESLPELPVDQVKQFVQVFEHIRQYYVEPMSDQELMQMALEGMLQRLDPHSQFLNAKDRQWMEESSEGAYSGIGIELSMEDGDLTIISPVEGSPAARAGLQPGDIILSINDQSIQGESIYDSLERMELETGDEVRLNIYRANEKKTLDIAVVAEKIVIKSVVSRAIDDDIVYLRIRQFQQTTAQELQQQWLTLENRIAKPRGVIIDLRNNPGGLLSAAIDVSDFLLEDGVIVSTGGRDPSFDSVVYATPGSLIGHIPLVVLMNAGSASASEIVAGAVQDHNRGVIVGNVSFGKGSVQQVIPINDEVGIKLTAARYFTPSGRSIQAQGIYPDIVVADDMAEQQQPVLAESQLNRHLKAVSSSNHSQRGILIPDLEDLVELEHHGDDRQLAYAVAVVSHIFAANKGPH